MANDPYAAARPLTTAVAAGYSVLMYSTPPRMPPLFIASARSAAKPPTAFCARVAAGISSLPMAAPMFWMFSSVMREAFAKLVLAVRAKSPCASAETLSR